MAKLFSDGDRQEVGQILPLSKNTEEPPVGVDAAQYADDLEMIMEGFKTASNDLKLVTTIAGTLDGKKAHRAAYFASLEALTPISQTIAANLGVRGNTPSLETFQTPMAFDASHDVAMEGFFDYLRKIWEKVRSFFVAFFKKIHLFFKRVFNADLELDEYEMYLDDLVARIKANKLEISDNKAKVTSRLPSLLANPGMDAVDVDFVVTHGKNKLMMLTQVIEDVFIRNILNDSKGDLGEIAEAISGLIKVVKNPQTELDTIQDTHTAIRKKTLNFMSGIMPHKIGDIKDLPEKVYSDLQHQFSRNEIDDLTTDSRSLLEQTSYATGLPKNFNAFYFHSETGKLFMSSIVEESQNVSDQLPAITVREKLIDFHQFYKKYSKSLKVGALEKSVDEVSDGIEDIIDLMHKKYTNVLDDIYRKKPTQQKGTISTLSDVVIASRELFKKDRTAYSDFLYELTTQSGVKNVEDLMGEIDHPFEGLPQDFELEGCDEATFIQIAASLLGETTSDGAPEMENREAKLKELEAIQKFILNFLTSFQVFLKEIATNLVGVYQQARYDMAKYIYDTCKLYGA